MEAFDDMDVLDRTRALNPAELDRLVHRLRNAKEGSTDLDVAIFNALGGKRGKSFWQDPLQTGWTSGPGPNSTSIDSALALFHRFFPDTESMHYSLVFWSGRRPSARVLYQERMPQAEGGWAFGALNPLQEHGATAPLAITIAAVLAIKGRIKSISAKSTISTHAENA